MLFTIIIFIETACLFFSLLYLRKAKDWWWLFIPFLLLTVFVEVTGYILYFIKGQSNHWVFNLYLPFEISFLFMLLYQVSKAFFKSSVFLLIAYAIFLGTYLWNSYQSGWKEYSSDANTLASFTIVIFSVLFYYFLLKQDSYVNLTAYPAFWLISGLFIFYLGALGCNLFVLPLTEIYKKTGVPVRYIIMLILNFILYASWGYAFICNFRQQISSSW